MNTFRMSQEKANSYVKIAFETLGYTDYKEGLEVRTFVNNEFVNYQILDEICYQGEMVKKITRLSLRKYCYLLREGLKINGLDNPNIEVLIRDDEVFYDVYGTMFTYGNKHHKNKKRRR